MTNAISDKTQEEYFTDGITILRAAIPAGLLADLRRETDRAREIARRERGPQCQRLQPVYAYDELKHQPFRDFLGLPALQAAKAMLGPEHQSSDNMGVLLEPAQAAWCTNWHRDWGHHVPSLDMALFFEASRNPRMFNQFNAALYDDHSLWAVPGSHDREDTPQEQAAFAQIPAPGPELTPAMSPEERELACAAYARRMPGATQVCLCAGDVAFYRACQWHIGAYVPYVKRATLHDGFYGGDDRAWREKMRQFQESRQ